MDLGVLYSNTRRAASKASTWRVRWRAWRARREYMANRSDPAQVRLVALEHELTKRGVKTRRPSDGNLFHRLA